MSDQHIIEALNRLSGAQAAARLVEDDYTLRRKHILEIVQDELDALDIEYAPLRTKAGEIVADLDKQVRRLVLEHGATVTGAEIQAVYTKGRSSWDTKSLEGYAVAHPEILTLRTVGQPSVSLRSIKPKEA